MLFLVAHANETEDQSYTIKHFYLHASSLLHAHVYVTLFGYKMSPEFYEPEAEEDVISPSQEYIDGCLNHTVEYFEESNRHCSAGEHFWHSIKEISDLSNQYPLQIEQNEQSTSLFKLTIRTKYPCSKHFDDEQLFYLYDTEQDTNIYQFQAGNIQSVVYYIFTHVKDYQGLMEFCEDVNQTPDQLANEDWQTISALCQSNLENCKYSSENCSNQNRIQVTCEEIFQPIAVFHSEI